MTVRQTVLLAAVALGLGAPPAAAQNAAAPGEWAIEFVGRMLSNADKAFQDFKAETYVGQTSAPSSETLREAFRKNVSANGPVQTYEVVAEQAIGERLRRVIILAYQARGVQAITMDFYKQSPGNGWFLYVMKIDTSLQAMPWNVVSPPGQAETKPR
jgi:hypothetical protein